LTAVKPDISLAAGSGKQGITMRSNVFTSHGYALALMLTLIACFMSIAAPPGHVRAAQGQVIYLPLIMNGAADIQPPSPTGAPEEIVRDRINFYRSLAGASQLKLHPTLVQAAQNHANYYLLNYADESAWIYGPHDEVADKPSYTGRSPGARASAAGYPWFAGWEAMHYVDSPTVSVDSWLATVFHRQGLLDPYLEYIGYGHGSNGSAQVDVIDFGHGTTETDRTQVIVFPAAGQINVPRYGSGEAPSPLPPDATYPIGYPITIQPTAFVPLIVTQAELRDSSGAPVAVYPSPSGCGTACYALIPIKPLQKATTYTVHAVGTIDGVPFDTTWSFTTTS
jgi:uncharacterized protein YkwD